MVEVLPVICRHQSESRLARFAVQPNLSKKRFPIFKFSVSEDSTERIRKASPARTLAKPLFRWFATDHPVMNEIFWQITVTNSWSVFEPWDSALPVQHTFQSKSSMDRWSAPGFSIHSLFHCSNRQGVCCFSSFVINITRLRWNFRLKVHPFNHFFGWKWQIILVRSYRNIDYFLFFHM